MSNDLDGYNPFENPSDQGQSNSIPQPSTTATTYSPPQPSTTTYSNASASNSRFVDPVAGMVQLSDADLSAKEAELARREMEIARQESLVANGIPVESVGMINRPKNFPPFIKFWKYYPEQEIPSDSQPLLKQIFILWLVIAGTYLVNWIVSFCCLACADALGSVGSLLVLSTVYLFVFIPVSYEVCFFVLYRALKEQRGLSFFCFLFTFAIWGLIIAWHTIGISEGGTVGWIQTIDLFLGKHSFVGFLGVVVSLAYTTCVAGVIYYWIKCWNHYKKNGLKSKAFGEASTLAAQYASQNQNMFNDSQGATQI